MFYRKFFRKTISPISGLLLGLVLLISCSSLPPPLASGATRTPKTNPPSSIPTAAIPSTSTQTATLTHPPTHPPTATLTLPPKIVGEKPAPRCSPGMAYDSARQVSVLVGRQNHEDAFYDTWEYDGQQWKRIDTELPAENIQPFLAYDEHRQKMVLFDSESSTLWEYDGSIWQHVETPPVYVHWPAIAYHPGLQKIVIFGEKGEGTSYETWSYDGVNIELIDRTITQPYLNFGKQYDNETVYRLIWPAMVYDPHHQEMLLQPTYNWTFALQGHTWGVRIKGSESPLPDCDGYAAGISCMDPNMVYDKKRDVIVLYDGMDTWEYAGENWVKIETPHAPLPRVFAAMTYDAARGVVVLFGGCLGGDLDRNDLWEYDGVTWVQR